MNYIKRLETERDTYHDGITRLRTYLHSEKFHSWNYVNVADILLRLSEIEQEVHDVPIWDEIVRESLVPYATPEQFAELMANTEPCQKGE